MRDKTCYLTGTPIQDNFILLISEYRVLLTKGKSVIENISQDRVKMKRKPLELKKQNQK